MKHLIYLFALASVFSLTACKKTNYNTNSHSYSYLYKYKGDINDDNVIVYPTGLYSCQFLYKGMSFNADLVFMGHNSWHETYRITVTNNGQTKAFGYLNIPPQYFPGPGLGAVILLKAPSTIVFDSRSIFESGSYNLSVN